MERAEAALILAGCGVIEGMREMCDAAAIVAERSDDPVVQTVGLVEAMTFARLAATHGQTQDRERFFFLLNRFALFQRAQGNLAMSDRFEAAALNLAEAMADEGHEVMAEVVARAGEAVSAEVFEEAKRQKEAAR